MHRGGILLYFVAIGFQSLIAVTGTDPTVKTTVPSQLQYSCGLSQHDLSITIYSDVGPTHFKTFWAIGNTSDNQRGNCTFHKEDVPIIISGCKADSPVDIIIAESEIAGFPEIIDTRYSKYRLTCYSGSASPGAPFTVIRDQVVNGGDPNAEEYEIAGLTLSVVKKVKDEKPIVVGDALVIEIKGPANLFYKALSCNASKASDTNKSIELIKNGKLIVGEDMKFLDLKQQMNATCIDSGTNNCVTANIRAFHFVDDNRVKFICTIQVCGTLCSRRRKRDTDTTGFDVKDLHTTVTVHDSFEYPLDKETTNASTIRYLSWMLAAGILLARTIYW